MIQHGSQKEMQASNETIPSEGEVLCVDLDGTLLKTDLLFESLIQLLKHKPLLLFMLPVWLMKGRSFLKSQLANNVTVNYDLLPENVEVVSFLQQAYSRGVKLILATASTKLHAEGVAKRYQIFSEVFSSTDSSINASEQVNLKGVNKAALLVERFGRKKFYYVGDSSADIPIWKESKGAYLVGADVGVQTKVANSTSIIRIFPGQKVSISTFLRSLRVHQWVKNLLLFAPLILAHQWMIVPSLLSVLGAFVCFSMTASGVYLLNDLCDLEADRMHRTKRNRPLASGDLPILHALIILPFLWVIAISLAVNLLPLSFVWALLTYWVTTTLYSFMLKKIAVLDVLTLATLYTLRIFAGALAAGVLISPWFFAFSMFFFLSLASVKRYSELFALNKQPKQIADEDPVTLQLVGRGYDLHDLPLLSAAGVTSGYISVLVLALYVNAEDARALYETPTLLWLVCPLLLYWITRVWLLTHRGNMHDDPIVFALKDKTSYLVGILILITFIVAGALRVGA